MPEQVVFFDIMDEGRGKTGCIVEPMPIGIKYIYIINKAVEAQFQDKVLEKCLTIKSTEDTIHDAILRDAAHEVAGQLSVSPTTCELEITFDNSPEGMALRKELLPISKQKDRPIPHDRISYRTIAWNDMDMAMKKIGLEDDVRKTIIEKAGTMRAR